MARLLVVDDEKSLCQLLEIAFRKKGHLVETASSGQLAKKKIESQVYDLIISDIRMPDLTGIDLLRYARESRNPAPFILITAVPTMSTAIQALNLGAHRYVVKTDTLVEELSVTVDRALEELALREENIRLRRELLRVFAAQNIVGHSRVIESILEMVRTVAPTTSTVLITGDSGTGKELVARAIHEASLRREKPFVSINCGAFPETLLESELFGYLKGAFTGAESNRKGIIESAHGGTLFLDEIGETSLGMQVKLLRVLQERTVRPLGGAMDVSVDVRLIASTNRDLKKMVANGQFREDFYYRVSVIPIHVPPLRERLADIEPLARHFLRKFALQMGKPLSDFDREALAALNRWTWPGNVRELENAVEHAVAVSDGRDGLIKLANFPESVTGVTAMNPGEIQFPPEGVDFENHIARIEKQYLQAALDAAGGVRSHAADLLKMSYRSFRHYAKKYGI
ncbi:MAG TPA: sigma-54 dependent transcriptional regulator [Terriglobia bacterium]|nr:sigma-54 dependent transcriptional regulator [Terriglobia bacterium]